LDIQTDPEIDLEFPDDILDATKTGIPALGSTVYKGSLTAFVSQGACTFQPR